MIEMLKKFPGTSALVALILVVFGVEIATGRMGDETALLALGAMPNDGMLNGQFWRPITYGLLHLDWAHLVLNLALLAWTGRIVERRLGSAGLIGSFTAGVLASGLTLWAVRTHWPKGGATLGASAGIFCLLGMALILVYRRDAAGFSQDRSLRLGLWACLGLGLAISVLPGVSLVGHLSGLVPGLLLAPWLPVRTETA